MTGFAARVVQAVGRTGPVCAGIDPSPSLLGAWGLPDTGEGLRAFGSRCIEAFCGVVPVVKPQVAFFERLGAAGMSALESVIGEARAAGMLVIADAKRGDIGNTVEAYASAWLDPASPLVADAVTAFAYMGIGSLQPMVDLGAAFDRGVIVVVRGSNPEGRPVQEALTGSGTGPAVEDLLLAEIADLNRALPGTVGAVVGSTLQPSVFPLRDLGGVILAPGMGTQGGTAANAGDLFRGCPVGSVLPHVSRSVLVAGPDVASLRAAVIAVRDEMAAVLDA